MCVNASRGRMVNCCRGNREEIKSSREERPCWRWINIVSRKMREMGKMARKAQLLEGSKASASKLGLVAVSFKVRPSTGGH